MAETSEKQPKRRRGPGRPFQPGQSGNPGGRAREYFDMRKAIREGGGIEAAYNALLAALESPSERVPAAKTICAYGLGQPTQSVEVSGAEGGPLQVAISINRTVKAPDEG